MIYLCSTSAPYSEYSFQVVASTIIGEGLQLSPSRMFATNQDSRLIDMQWLNALECNFILVSTPPRNLVAKYVSTETTSSTALQVTWNHPQCDYSVRTGYTVCASYY